MVICCLKHPNPDFGGGGGEGCARNNDRRITQSNSPLLELYGQLRSHPHLRLMHRVRVKSYPNRSYLLTSQQSLSPDRQTRLNIGRKENSDSSFKSILIRSFSTRAKTLRRSNAHSFATAAYQKYLWFECTAHAHNAIPHRNVTRRNISQRSVE